MVNNELPCFRRMGFKADGEQKNKSANSYISTVAKNHC